MIINVAHTKGGVGKTTIAVNIALTLGADVFDLDTQHSSASFAKNSDEPKSIKFYTDQAMAGKLIEKFNGNPTEHLIIDSGGYDSRISRLCIMKSNLIITPLTVSPVEFQGLLTFDRAVIHNLVEVNPAIRPYALLNNINSFDKADAEALRETIKKMIPDYKVLKTTIGYRKLFKQAFSYGQSVVEFNRSSKAAKEIIALCKEIEEICHEIAAD